MGARLRKREVLVIPVVWIGGIIVTVATAWLTGFLNQFLPPPQRAWLAIENVFKAKSPLPEQRFRLVLCWLENDGDGRDTRTVADAFTSIEGIELVRSACVVSASGAADDWRPAMRKGTIAVLERWNADLAVVGAVKEPGRVLSLWFVPGEGDGTLRRGDQPYELVNVSLPAAFHAALRAQLTAEALRAAAPFARTEMRGQVLNKGLNGVIEKIAALLAGGMVVGAVGVAMAVWPEKRKDPKVVVADANPMRVVVRLGEATGRASPATYRQLRDVGLSRCKCVVVMARQRAKKLRGGYR